MKILAIFTCYNRCALTEQSIQTLGKNRDVTFDFVAVDDASTDNTAKMLAAQPVTIDIVQGTGGLFWNGGMHRAVEHAKSHYPDYEYYMLMNDDTRFVEGIFDEIAPTLRRDVVTVGAIRDDSGSLSYGGIRYTRGIHYEMLGPDRSGENCSTFNANCVIVPHDIFMQVGIDPFYKHSIGDFDYGLQIHRMGYEIHVYPRYVGQCNDNSILHTWQDPTLGRMERIRLKESPKGLPADDWFHFLRKNFGLGTAVFRTVTPYLKILLGR